MSEVKFPKEHIQSNSFSVMAFFVCNGVSQGAGVSPGFIKPEVRVLIGAGES